jgi:hypothetical protein
MKQNDKALLTVRVPGKHNVFRRVGIIVTVNQKFDFVKLWNKAITEEITLI